MTKDDDDDIDNDYEDFHDEMLMNIVKILV